VTARFLSTPDLAAGHNIVIDAPDTLPGIWDGPRLDQVLTNLISNALKYSPGASEVRVQIQRSGDEAIVAVSDTGVGISEEDVAELFKPFARGATPDRNVSGTGLGLFISQQIVERHQGTLSVSSAIGLGTTFTLRLPLDSRERRPPAN
jgi:signal transduction histidine kinase